MIQTLKIDCDDGEFSAERIRALENVFQDFLPTDVTLRAEIIFVDETEIRRLNRELRQTDKVTDVLSFPALESVKNGTVKACEHPFEIDEDGMLLLGSIAVCTKRAKEQAEGYGHSYERELHYLIVHGILHCLGYDHMQETDKIEMREQEERVLSTLGITRE